MADANRREALSILRLEDIVMADNQDEHAQAQSRMHYNRVAGQSLERVAALSDGVFAVALTLLVLDLRVPAADAIRSERDLIVALWLLVPHLLPYFLSFMTLGIFWIGQQTQLSHFARSDRTLTWIHLGFLLAITLLPFSTALLSAFITYRVALLVYWLHLLLLGILLLTSWLYAQRVSLIKAETTIATRHAVTRRIIVYQALYGCSVLACVVNTYVSIALIIVLQLNSALAPRIRPLR